MRSFDIDLSIWGPLAAMVLVAAAAGTAALAAILLPVLRRYILARPTVRSSHTAPTPQGGGLAVIAATIATITVAAMMSATFGADIRLAWVCGAAVALTIMGAVDDVTGLAATPRLLFQVIAVGLVIAALPADLHVFSILPWWVERTLFVIGGLWFVNAVNFMDGIDWMSVAEVVPVAGGLALLGIFGALPPHGILVALALCGAMLGFAPFNYPVARLFLGDAGSLPIGLMLVWLLLLLAGSGHVAAAVLLPLYYVADATITLMRRLLNGEALMTAHRRHYYQQALDSGFTVLQIVSRVFILNVALVVLALTTIFSPTHFIQVIALGIGGALVFALLYKFSMGPAHSR
jgi:UDP-N-acetylmuramyl pentapeptide phosphotransferase/UDP-N-acetylglucosamine-1-phosphate transferase